VTKKTRKTSPPATQDRFNSAQLMGTRDGRKQTTESRSNYNTNSDEGGSGEGKRVKKNRQHKLRGKNSDCERNQKGEESTEEHLSYS